MVVSYQTLDLTATVLHQIFKQMGWEWGSGVPTHQQIYCKLEDAVERLNNNPTLEATYEGRIIVERHVEIEDKSTTFRISLNIAEEIHYD